MTLIIKNWSKLVLSMVFLTVGAMVVLDPATISPALPVSVFALTTLVVVLGTVHQRNRSPPPTLVVYLVPVLVALFLRGFIYFFTGSYFAGDAQRYGLMVHQLVETSRVDSMSTWYVRMPAFPLLASIFKIVSQTTVKQSIGIFPLLIGVLGPVVPTMLAVKIADRRRFFVGLSVGILAALTTTSVWFSFAPHAQSHSYVLWLTVLLMLFVSDFRLSRRTLVLYCLILVAMTFSHKLPVLAVLFVTVPIALITFLIRALSHETGAATGELANVGGSVTDQIPAHSLALVVLPGVLFAVQLGIISNLAFFVALMFRPSPGGSGPSLVLEPSAAVPTYADVPILRAEGAKFLLEAGYTFGLLTIAGVAWVFVAWWWLSDRNDYRRLCLLVATAAGGALITTFGLTGIVATSRLMLFFEPLFVVLVGLFVSRSIDSVPRPIYAALTVLFLLGAAIIGYVRLVPNGLILDDSYKNLVLGVTAALVLIAGTLGALIPQVRRRIPGVPVVVVIVLAGVLLFSTTAIPDMAGTPRDYLTAQECDGQAFLYEHYDSVAYADAFYESEHCPAVLPIIANGEDPDVRELDAELIDRNPPLTDRTTVLYREDITTSVATRSGDWRLQWDPEPELATHHSKVYSNDPVSLYTDTE